MSSEEARLLRHQWGQSADVQVSVTASGHRRGTPLINTETSGNALACPPSWLLKALDLSLGVLCCAQSSFSMRTQITVDMCAHHRGSHNFAKWPEERVVCDGHFICGILIAVAIAVILSITRHLPKHPPLGFAIHLLEELIIQGGN